MALLAVAALLRLLAVALLAVTTLLRLLTIALALLAVGLVALGGGVRAGRNPVRTRGAVAVAVTLAVLVTGVVVAAVLVVRGGLLAAHEHQHGADDAAEQEQQADDQHRGAPTATDLVGPVAGEQLTLVALALRLVPRRSHAVGGASDLPVLLAVGLDREVGGRLVERGGLSVVDDRAAGGASVALLGAVDREAAAGGRDVVSVREAVEAHLRAGQHADQQQDQTEHSRSGRDGQERILVAGRVRHGRQTTSSGSFVQAHVAGGGTVF